MSGATYVALLRAVNVGGRNKVPMADLRDLMDELGFDDVETYIQSGNIVFDADRDEAAVAAAIEAALLDRFGFEVPTVVRPGDDVVELASQAPLVGPGDDGAKHHVFFLAADPDPAAVGTIDREVVAPDRLIVAGRHVHAWFPDGAGRSKLTAAWLERQLGVRATARNRTTIGRLADMVSDRAS